jgi:glutaredoxin
MKLPEHECPYGLKAKRMLDEAGVAFEDRLLTSREEVDRFEEELGVDTTPQVFVDGQRIGGSEELAEFLQSAEA